jgi:hypothetical protein
VTADPAQIVLHAVGEPLEFPEDTWRTDPTEAAKWRATLREAVSEHDPWALLGQRPDGKVHVFDTDWGGADQCASWSTRVWLMFPVEAYSG